MAMRVLIYLLKKYWFAVVVVVMVAIFFGIISSNQKLAVYTKDDRAEYTVIKEEETEFLPDTGLFQSDRIHLSMEVPSRWNHVLKSGHDTFIDEKTASSVQLQILDYAPEINNDSDKSLAEELSKKGFTPVSFTPQSPVSYTLFYQGSSIDGIINYYDYVIWDRAHIVKICFIFPDSITDRMSPLIDHILNSVCWEMEEPIPDGTGLFYDEISGFEFGYPARWEHAITEDGVFYAMDTENQTGSQMTVSILEDETNPGTLSQYEYSVSLESGKSNFLMTSFRQDENSILAEASFTGADGQKMLEVQYVSSDGRHIFVVTFDFPQEAHDLVYDTALTCIDLCRFDRSSPESEEVLAEEETSESSADDSSLWDLFLQEADQNEDRSIKRSGEEDDTQVNASTFSDALMSILSMEKDQADRISKVWDSLSIGQAVYLQGVKEDDTSVLLAARAENGMDYYLTIRKEDYELIRISVGSEYGSTVFG